MKKTCAIATFLAIVFAAAICPAILAQEDAPAQAGEPQAAPAAEAPLSITEPPPGIPLRDSTPAVKPAPAVASEAPAPDPAKRPTVVVLPVRNAAYEGKDKFYGDSADLSLALQQFISFSVDTLSDNVCAVRMAPDKLYGRYPVEEIFTGQSDTLAAVVNVDILSRAANVEDADIVVAAEVRRAAVLVDDLKWTMDVEVRALAWDKKTSTVLWEQTFANQEVYVYTDKKQKDAAGGGSILTFSGRKTTAADIAQNPILFGGTINGYPFVSVARQLVSRF